MSNPVFRQAAKAAGLIGLPLALVALLGATVASSADERVIVSFLITVSLALAIQSFSGLTGILSFGHVAFLGIGAYVGALLTIPSGIKATVAPGLPSFVLDAQLSLWVTLPIAFIVAGTVAGVIGLVFARMEPTAMAMATVSLLLIFGVLLQAADDLTGGSQGLYAIPQATTMSSALLVAVLMVFVTQMFERSRAGLQLKASRSAPLAAESLGVRLIRLRWVAWTLAGALIGLAGAVWAGYAIAFSPGQFDFDLTFSLLAALVVGGIASVTGTVAGAALLTVAFEGMRRLEESVAIEGLTQISVAILILVVLYFFPRGLLGTAELPELLQRDRQAGHS